MIKTLVKEKANFANPFPNTSLEVEVEELSAEIVVVRIYRKSAAEVSEDLSRHLRVSAVKAAQFVILDLTSLRSISNAELSTISEFRRAFLRQGGEIWLAGIQPAVWLALRLSHCDRV